MGGNARPNPPGVRAQARERFFLKVASALEMAMSKHDQVMVPGVSITGRTGIPTCVACDRPLPGKKRIGELVRESDRVIENTKLDPPSSKPPRPKSSDGKAKFGPAGDRARPRSSGGGGGSMSNAAPAPMGQQQGAYIYRGGFKMPRRDGGGGS